MTYLAQQLLRLHFLFFPLLLLSCVPNDKPPAKPTKIRNVILLIGDGMGPQQISLAASYKRLAKEPAGQSRVLHIENLLRDGETGLMLTFPHGNVVVDSAASATQIATGQMARAEMIGTDINGQPAETILEKAKRSGRSTGLVSNTRLTHATPAAFAAHQLHRSMENQIAQDLISGDVDVMFSSGYRYFLPQSVNDSSSPDYKRYRSLIPSPMDIASARNDDLDLLKLAQEKGYSLIFDRTGLQTKQSQKILGLFGPGDMPSAIEEGQTEDDPNRIIPNLREMAAQAIEILSKNPEGFFLMIESGQIDWAGHANDVGYMLHEMLRFDELVGMVMEWAKQRDDTLVVLTADHETGSFGFSYSSYNLPEPILLPDTGKTFHPDFNFGTFDIFDRIYAQKKTFAAMFQEYNKLPAEQKNPASLQKIVNENIAFPISLEQAERILLTEENPDFQENHKYLGQKTVPKIDDFREFYVYPQNILTALLARQIARNQHVVWGTGTHTATPVVVGAYGPQEFTAGFNGLWHSTEVSRKIMAAMDLPLPEQILSSHASDE